MSISNLLLEEQQDTTLKLWVNDVNCFGTVAVKGGIQIESGESAPIEDLPLITYIKEDVDCEWKYDDLTSTTIVNGLEFIKIGRIVHCKIAPFEILGTPTNPASTIQCSVEIPLAFQNGGNKSELQVIRMDIDGVKTWMQVDYENSDNRLVIHNLDFNNINAGGATNFGLLESNELSYITEDD